MLAANIVPKAVDDTAVTTGNVPVVIDVIANDFDRDGTVDATSVAAKSSPRGGTVDVFKEGSVKYTPPKDQLGVDSFTYSIQDNYGAESNAANVSIHVRSSHQNPKDHMDVNADGRFSPIDVLVVISALNEYGPTQLPMPPAKPFPVAPYRDINGDGFLTVADALEWINCANDGVYMDRISPLCVQEPAPSIPSPQEGSPVDPQAPEETPPEVIDAEGSKTDPTSEDDDEPIDLEPPVDETIDIIAEDVNERMGLRGLTARGLESKNRDVDNPLVPGGISELDPFA